MLQVGPSLTNKVFDTSLEQDRKNVENENFLIFSKTGPIT